MNPISCMVSILLSLLFPVSTPGSDPCLQAAGGAEEPGARAAALDRRIEAEPDNAGLLLCRGIARYEAGRYGPAAEDLDRVLALRPDDPTVLRLRAWSRFRSGHHAEALADAEAAGRAGGGDDGLVYARAVFAEAAGDTRAALDGFSQCAAGGERTGRCNAGLARIHSRLGHDREAAEAAGRALSGGPAGVEAAASAVLRLQACERLADHGCIVDAATRALELKQTPADRADLLLSRGSALVELGRNDPAAADFESALSLIPAGGGRQEWERAALLHYLLYRAHRAAGRRQAAEAALTQALTFGERAGLVQP